MNQMILSRRALANYLFLAVVVGSTAYSTADEPAVTWSQWRGPQRDGSVGGPAWQCDLQEPRLQEQWRVALDPSYSGPIVAEDRVFVTETKDKSTEVVRALDRSTGQQLWQASWPGALDVPFFAKSNGDWIRATPAFDGERLYVAGMRDVLVALDSRDGEQQWRVDFVQEFASSLPAFGFVSSPLVAGEFVYVQAGSGLVKLSKKTGKVAWRSLVDEGGMNGSAFSSPMLATLCGQTQLVVQTRSLLAGVDPERGDVLWSVEVPAFRGMNILTPTIVGDRVFISVYGGKTTLFRVSRADDKWRVEVEWSQKSQGYMSSPVVIDGHAYLHLRNQRFTCIDLATGKETWTTKPFGQYWSLAAQGNKILALDERGELLLIGANATQFTLLDSRSICQVPAWAHVAVCNRNIYVRPLDALIALRWEAD
jgi:outer membrane protein assembly factor BamB